jgi:hypothetical protein
MKIWTVAAGVCLAGVVGAAARAETIYITAARMVDPAAGRVVEGPAVIV